MADASDQNGQTGKLRDVQWEKRVVVIFADETGEESDRQIDLFLGDRDALKDRDIAIFTVHGDDVQAAYGAEIEPSADTLRHELDVPPGHFRVVLIGKDGHVKDRFEALVEPSVIFSIIDSMPMRKAERSNPSDKRTS